MSKFKKGDIVCLVFDRSQKFLVESACDGVGIVGILYFNPFIGEVKYSKISEEYLCLIPQEGEKNISDSEK